MEPQRLHEHLRVSRRGELPHPVHLAQERARPGRKDEDWHSFGLSYAETLRQWWRNMRDFEGYSFEEYPERFRRLWKHYLMCSAASFARRRDETVADRVHEAAEREASGPVSLRALGEGILISPPGSRGSFYSHRLLDGRQSFRFTCCFTCSVAFCSP
ncbi:unnamed protein product [Prorocentrum cordatum]|uniref:Cyclopropane-fatty-acyl-phospholipid synthase n=1 Tax=Prorocentrum cordatum TaxID=2364126 RepID=A0ABN9V0F3_9DINO|nr:unnamed protein product [Polarella glacialis]